MLKSNIFEQVSEQVNQVLSNNPFVDTMQNLKTIVMAILNKLDLVTREEFDTQQKVLAATRQKLELLEAELNSFKNSTNKE